MKYIVIVLMYLAAVYTYLMLGFVDNGWQYVQPFLVVSLLVYFNVENDWLYYVFAAVCGLTVDSLSGVFGLHAVVYIFLIFIIKNLQLTILTSKNILAIILLSVLSFAIFWSFFWLANFVAWWNIYNFHQLSWSHLFRGFGINIFLIFLLHLLYYNFFLRKHVQQSF